MITYPLSMPVIASLGPRKITFGANNLISASVSPFTGSQQIVQWLGEWWEAEIGLPEMTLAQAEPWIAFLTALRGMLGTFYLGDPSRTAPQGVATGSPVVDGAQASGGNQLVTSGWTANVNGILLPGDYIQVGTGATQRLYKNLTQANSNSSGVATLDIFPVIRAEGVTNGEAIVTANPMGTFRLTGNWRSWQVDYTRLRTISFKAMEAI